MSESGSVPVSAEDIYVEQFDERSDFVASVADRAADHST